MSLPRTSRFQLPRVFRPEILFVAASKAINGVSTLLLNLYAAKFLVPAEFGVLTLCTTFLVLLDSLFGAAIDLSVAGLSVGVRDARSGPAEAERSAFALKALGCALVCGSAIAFAGPLGRLILHRSSARPAFVACSMAATAILLLRSSQIALQMRQFYKLYSALELLNTTGRVLLAVYVLHQNWVSATAVVFAFGGAASVALLSGFLALGFATRSWRWFGLRAAKQLIHTARTPLATYGFSAIVSKLDIFVLAVAGTPVQLGIYGSSLTLATIPETACTYLASAFMPRIIPYCRQGTFRHFFARFHQFLFVLFSVTCIAGVLLLPYMGPHILPPKYLPALAVTAILLPGTLATASLFPLTLSLLMLRSSTIFLRFDLFTAVFLAFAYWFAAKYAGIQAVAVVAVVYRLVKTAVVQVRAMKEAGLAEDAWEEVAPLDALATPSS